MKDYDDYDDVDIEEEAHVPPAPKGFKIAGRVLSGFFWGIIILINAILFIRMFTSGDPSSMKEIEATREVAVAYKKWNAEAEDNEYKYFGISNQPGGITDSTIYTYRSDELYGCFAITNSALFPTAEQVQLVLRSNKSTYTAAAKVITGVPEPDITVSEENLLYVLRVETCTRVEEWDDEFNEYKIRYEQDGFYELSPTSESEASKLRHEYKKFVFNGIDISRAYAIYLDIYYSEDGESETKRLETLQIFDVRRNYSEYSLSKSEIKALEKAGN